MFTHSQRYRAWFIADTGINIGTNLRNLVIPLIAFALSQSTVTAGWVTTACMVAMQMSAVFGGTVVDRHDRKRLMVINCLSGFIIWGIVAFLIAAQLLTLPILLCLSVIYSVVNGLLSHASDALLRSIVDVRHYSQARSINEGRDAVTTMASSPFGGFLYALGAWIPFAISAVIYVVSAVAAAAIPTATVPVAEVPHDEASEHVSVVKKTNRSGADLSFLYDFVAGWKWSLQRRTLVLAMIISALLNLGLAGTQYAVQLSMVAIGESSVRIGFLDTAICVGVVLGSVVSSRIAAWVHTGKALCVGFA